MPYMHATMLSPCVHCPHNGCGLSLPPRPPRRGHDTQTTHNQHACQHPFPCKKKKKKPHERIKDSYKKKKARGRVSICMRFGALFHHHKEMYACIARPAAHSLRSGFGGARYALGIIVPYRPVSAFSVGWVRSPRCRLVQLASRRIRSMVVGWWCRVAELEYSMDPLMQASSANLPLHASTRPRGRQHLPVRHAPARGTHQQQLLQRHARARQE